MSGHAPGPWRVDIVGNPEARGRLPLCYKHAPADGYDNICYMSGYHGSQSEANARLIASAPDLLEATERLLSLAKRFLTDEAEDEFIALIARAKGEL